MFGALQAGAGSIMSCAGFFGRISPDRLYIFTQDCSAQYTRHENDSESSQVFQGRSVVVDHVNSRLGKTVADDYRTATRIRCDRDITCLDHSLVHARAA